jgi:hypothetical protein
MEAWDPRWCVSSMARVVFRANALIVELDGVVEYKSLPSGLHNCDSDLVYFVHEQYAGISAFANRPAHESERNAHFAAVGLLVPLTYGRLGRSWLHAHQLRQLVAYAPTPNYCHISR